MFDKLYSHYKDNWDYEMRLRKANMTYKEAEKKAKEAADKAAEAAIKFPFNKRTNSNGRACFLNTCLILFRIMG